jgi:hypothetical protein
MLISDSHQFIFLRMRKVASTSMKTILLPMCLPRPAGRIAHLKSRAWLEWDYHRYVFRAHDDIRAAQRRMPAESFTRYFKFAFVRNPWDRLVSEYNFLLERPAHGRHKKVKKLSDFKHFIHMQVKRNDAYQINMLCDQQGKLLMDFVGKLENLEEDWQTVCKKIGIPYQQLQRKNATQHRHYQDYYDDETRQLVGRHWSREIELFEYTFGGND